MRELERENVERERERIERIFVIEREREGIKGRERRLATVRRWEEFSKKMEKRKERKGKEKE